MKRHVLLVSLAIPVLLLPAFAAYLESDKDPAKARDEIRVPVPPPRPPRPLPPPRPAVPWAYQNLVANLDVGNPYNYRGITLFPLTFRGRTPSSGIVTPKNFASCACHVGVGISNTRT